MMRRSASAQPMLEHFGIRSMRLLHLFIAAAFVLPAAPLSAQAPAALKHFISEDSPVLVLNDVRDIATASRKGKQRFLANSDLSAGSLYDHVSELATDAGWQFGAKTADHLIGHLPHESNADQAGRHSIRRGNPLNLRARDATAAKRHWVLEIHFIDDAHAFDGFFAELLPIGPA